LLASVAAVRALLCGVCLVRWLRVPWDEAPLAAVCARDGLGVAFGHGAILPRIRGCGLRISA